MKADDKKRLTDVWLPALFIAAVLGAVTHFFIDAFCGDARMALYENMDGNGVVGSLYDIVSTGNYLTPRTPFMIYGASYYYAGALLLWVIEAARGISSQLDVYLALRWLGVVSTVGCCALYFPLQRVGKLPAWFPYVATAILLTAHEIFYYTFVPKPDNFQHFFTLWMVIELYRLRKRRDLSILTSVSIACGLVNAAKLGGVFLWPLIPLMDLLRFREQRSPIPWKTVCQRAAFSVGVASVVFILLNLRWILDFQFNWTKVVWEYENGWKRGGAFWSWEWLPIISSWGYLLIACWVIYLGRLIRQIVRRPTDMFQLEAEPVLVAFGLFYAIFLCKMNHYGFSQRYTLPILPSILIGGIQTLESARRWLQKQLRKPAAKPLSFAALAILLMFGDLNRWRAGVHQMLALRTYEQSPRVEAGKWLLKRYPAKTTFFFSFSWWVPDFFNTTWNLRHCPFTLTKILAATDPDVVLLIEGEDPKCNSLLDVLRNKQTPFALVADLPAAQPSTLRYLVFERRDLKQRLAAR